MFFLLFLDPGTSNIRKIVKNYTLGETFNFEICCMDSQIMIEIGATVDWFEKFSYKVYDIQPSFLQDKLNCRCSHIDVTGTLQNVDDMYHWNESTTFDVNVSFTYGAVNMPLFVLFLRSRIFRWNFKATIYYQLPKVIGLKYNFAYQDSWWMTFALNKLLTSTILKNGTQMRKIKSKILNMSS